MKMKSNEAPSISHSKLRTPVHQNPNSHSLFSFAVPPNFFKQSPFAISPILLLWNHYLGNSEKEIKSFMLLQNKMKPSILKSSSIHFEKSNIHLIFGKKTSAVFSNYSP